MNSIFCLTFVLSVNLTVSKPFNFINNGFAYKNINNGSGNYEFQFNTLFTRPEDDLGQSETGKLEKSSSGEEVLRVNGTYHYMPSCYEWVRVNYTADENGFKAKIIQGSGIKYERVNGTIVGISVVCSASANQPISANCLASLQGSCVG